MSKKLIKKTSRIKTRKIKTRKVTKTKKGKTKKNKSASKVRRTKKRKQMGGSTSKVTKTSKTGKTTKKCQCLDYDVDKKNNLLIVDGVNGKKCQRDAVNGTNFCQKHQNCLGFLKLYRSGYEPEYNPKKWSPKEIEKTHNCYTYYLNNQVKSIQKRCQKICPDGKKCYSRCSDLKPQPGDFHLLMRDGNLKKKKRVYTCQEMESKILLDNPSIKKSKLLEKCPKGSYKGALVVDPDHTYHFYRQDANGLWSHKPGTLPITNLDASGKLIYAPHIADRDYSKGKKNKDDAINYTDFCRYYCVPDNKIIDLHSI